MPPYVGDYNLGTTFHHRITTVNGSGVPTTLGNTPSAQYYVDGGTTAFTAGLTLTADFNSVVGLNSLAVICTSSATGLTSGINVSVQIAAGTVSAVSLVGYPIIEYSITRRSPLRPATANRTVLISSTGYAAIDWAAIGTPGSTQSLSATTLFTATNVTNNVGAVVTAVNTITPARITAQGIDVGAIVTAVNTITPARVTAQGIDVGAIVTAVSTIVPARVTAQGIDIGAIVTAVSTIVPARVTAQGIDIGAIVTAFNTIAPANVTAYSTGFAAIQSLLDDARTEPAQGTPPVNPDAVTKIDYLYKAWRNRTAQTTAQYSLYADDATTIDQKATFSDDGTTADRGEVATGP